MISWKNTSEIYLCFILRECKLEFLNSSSFYINFAYCKSGEWNIKSCYRDCFKNMLLKDVIQSCCEKKNDTFSTQWFLEVNVSELKKSQYNCDDADLWNCNWKSENNMLTTRAVVFEGLRMRRTKQFIDECLKTTLLDKSLLKCYLIKLCRSRSFWVDA